MIPKIHTGLTERQMHRRFWLASSGSVLAGLSVALAAYAAHAGLGDKAQGNLQQAALFAFGHGVALAALALQTCFLFPAGATAPALFCFHSTRCAGNACCTGRSRASTRYACWPTEWPICAGLTTAHRWMQ